MAANEYRGEVDGVLAGRPVRLCATLDGWARLECALLAAGLRARDPASLAEVPMTLAQILAALRGMSVAAVRAGVACLAVDPPTGQAVADSLSLRDLPEASALIIRTITLAFEETDPGKKSAPAAAS